MNMWERLADRRALKRYRKATRMDKTLDEYFDDMKDLPKGPIRPRKKMDTLTDES